VQLRYQTGLTSDEYVSREAWREATLERCPLHPRGGCGLARHGTYERKHPPGAHVARWRCPEGHCTFSLLPDCLAARLPGALVELEAVIAVAEQATSVEAAANAVRTDDIGLVGAIRWVLRRRNAVHANLLVLKGLLPERFAECPPTVAGFRRRLGTDRALEALREVADAHLHALGAPLGFAPPGRGGGERKRRFQHHTGPDPPNQAR
jgi:hypothetical protein